MVACINQGPVSHFTRLSILLVLPFLFFLFYHVLSLPDTKRDIHIVLFIDMQSPRKVHAILSWSFRILHV